MLLSYQQAFLDGLLVNAFCPHSLCHILFGVPAFEEGEDDVGEGLYCLFDALGPLLLLHVNVAECGTFSMEMQIIESSDQECK